MIIIEVATVAFRSCGNSHPWARPALTQALWERLWRDVLCAGPSDAPPAPLSPPWADVWVDAAAERWSRAPEEEALRAAVAAASADAAARARKAATLTGDLGPVGGGDGEEEDEEEDGGGGRGAAAGGASAASASLSPAAAAMLRRLLRDDSFALCSEAAVSAQMCRSESAGGAGSAEAVAAAARLVLVTDTGAWRMGGPWLKAWALLQLARAQQPPLTAAAGAREADLTPAATARLAALITMAAEAASTAASLATPPATPGAATGTTSVASQAAAAAAASEVGGGGGDWVYDDEKGEGGSLTVTAVPLPSAAMHGASPAAASPTAVASLALLAALVASHGLRRDPYVPTAPLLQQFQAALAGAVLPACDAAAPPALQVRAWAAGIGA